MTPAEIRMLNELGVYPARRILERSDKDQIVMESIGGATSYGGNLSDPKHFRFSRKALTSLLKKQLMELESDKPITNTISQKVYKLTRTGLDEYLKLRKASGITEPYLY